MDACNALTVPDSVLHISVSLGTDSFHASISHAHFNHKFFGNCGLKNKV